MRVVVYETRHTKLPKREFEVFTRIVERGPKTEYQLIKELDISSGTIHRALGKLVKKGLLKAVPRGKARTGLPIKEYHLTLVGLYAGITLCGEVNKVVERWRSLDPLILGKWRHLTGVVPEAEAVEALKHAAANLYNTLYLDEEDKLITDGPLIQHALRTEFFSYMIDFPHRCSIQKWIEALRSDEELKRHATSFLRQRLWSQQYQLYRAEGVLRGIRGEEFTLDGLSEKVKRKAEEWR